jgi:hypothetical protein
MPENTEKINKRLKLAKKTKFFLKTQKNINFLNITFFGKNIA